MPEAWVTKLTETIWPFKVPGSFVNAGGLWQLKPDGIQNLEQTLDEILPKMQPFISSHTLAYHVARASPSSVFQVSYQNLLGKVPS
jgi:hypothetical protein